MIGSIACPACGSATVRPLARTAALPVMSNVYPATAARARAVPRTELELIGCDGCGLMFNRSFDPQQIAYDADYETSLHHSPRFRAYADALARELTSSFATGPATVIEIGCGRGEFLSLLAGDGRRCIGFDRSYDGRHPTDPGLDIRAHDFDPDRDDVRGDLVICRHVLEHVADPRPLLRTLSAAVTRGGIIYVEIPNGLWTLRDGGVWDLIYEHCNYFTPRALAAAAHRAGLGVMREQEAFGGQFLQAFLSAGADQDGGGDAPVDLVPGDTALFDRFRQVLHDTLADWQARIRDYHAQGLKVAAWGAGSKAVTFLCSVAGADAIEVVVDLNPRKQGHHIPGAGQRIVAPSELCAVAPDVVLVMNPLYRDEIAAALLQMGLRHCIVECVN